ncbi:MAG: (E)-4-hydroxy-3-methylbut-2-enyl-diphosphate synthase [Bacteroidales bacterium]|nr:(E)-4-hydroxy-3-methylbut-2-enyl-diphosphate synthase [Bacteroidales bacterium]
MKNGSIEVKVGNIIIGGNNPVVIQSMTNTDTLDTAATVEQTVRLVEQGCQMVRITAADISQAENLYNIKNELIKCNINVPLVADIHFNPKAAEISASVVEKIRINPGNYVDRKWNPDYTEKDYEDILNKAKDNIFPLIDICKKHGTAVRIGVNHGSLSERILFKYGNTPLAMAESAMEFLRMFNEMDFHKIVVSMKASDVPVMYRANKILVDKMQKENMYYPLHLGVTEAGNGQEARIKSICGIAPLLLQGIGDTIRVSLTEKPENEIPIAKQIADIEKNNDIYYIGKTALDLLEGTIKTLPTEDDENMTALKKINTPFEKNKTPFHENKTAFYFNREILQSLGLKRYKAEFVACPSCGRTKYDIETALAKVKSACSHLKGLKIAVMGCIVNGPGEMADADYGYIGAGNNTVNLYRGKNLILSHVDETKAIDELIGLIKQDGNWEEPSAN